MKHYKEHIFSLEDRHESDISPLWQILQILFFTCCIIFGFTICFAFGRVMVITQSNCILYAHLDIATYPKDSLGRSHDIQSVTSEFHLIYCELVFFIPVMVSTFACFFSVMFAYCGRGGAGNQSLQETWRIIMPTIFFNLISLCLSAYMAHVFQSGLKQFLRSVATYWGRRTINLDEISTLSLDGVSFGDNLIRYLSITKHTTWLFVSSWGLNFLWILLRLLFNVDFQLVRTTIHVYPKKQNVREVWEDYKIYSQTSLDSSLDSHNNASVRLRTVQFTPSTLGPAPTPLSGKNLPLRKHSSEDKDESEEVEIAKVDYSDK